MKRLKQAERTKRDIVNAVIILLSHKKIEKITVNEIVEEAKITRSTFYAYFLDKYDLLEYIQRDIVSELTNNMLKIIKDNTQPIPELDKAFALFCTENNTILKYLLSIKSEYIDIRNQFSKVIGDYIKNFFGDISKITTQIMSDIWITYLSNALENPTYSQHFTEAFYNITIELTLTLFNLNEPNAKEKLIEFVRDFTSI